MAPDKQKCGVCKKDKKTSQVWIQCDEGTGCGQWYHVDCIGLAGATASMIAALKQWKCATKCQLKKTYGNDADTSSLAELVQQTVTRFFTSPEFKLMFGDILKSLLQEYQLDKRMKKTESSLLNQSNLLNSLEENVKRQEDIIRNLQETVKQLKSESIVRKDTSVTSNSFADIVKNGIPKESVSLVAHQIRREEAHQAKCNMNLIIKGLPAKDASDTKDQEEIKDMAESINVTLEGTRLSSKRVGNIRADGSQLLILTLPVEKKTELLKASKKLMDTTDWKHVFISPDKTKAQQHADFMLRQELRLRKSEEPESSWYIHRGKVIKRN